jgi:hypothetical protein
VREGEVQERESEKFRCTEHDVHLEHARIFIIIRFNFYHHGQFKSVSGRSSDAPNTAVHLEDARFLFKSYLTFTNMSNSGALLWQFMSML